MAAKQQWKWGGRTELIRVRVEPARRLALLDAAESVGISEAEAIRRGLDLFVAQVTGASEGKAR